jgi:hypothetical protein
MAHPVLALNPFDVLLRLHHREVDVDKDFSFWLRHYRDPPIRTVSALIDNCPRVDWLFWFLEQLVLIEQLESVIVIAAGHVVYRSLELIKEGRVYSRDRGPVMPHTEGLNALRAVLRRDLNGG